MDFNFATLKRWLQITVFKIFSLLSELQFNINFRLEKCRFFFFSYFVSLMTFKEDSFFFFFGCVGSSLLCVGFL